VFDIIIAIIMVAIVTALVAFFLKYKADTSERRMKKMLQRIGLDPEIFTQADSESIIREVRRRCRKCESEDLCERWLASEEGGDNDFCPNAKVFEELKRTSPT